MAGQEQEDRLPPGKHRQGQASHPTQEDGWATGITAPRFGAAVQPPRDVSSQQPPSDSLLLLSLLRWPM